jgi:pSer/pThr/pTyr-binding forkhead associated (FHA) protein
MPSLTLGFKEKNLRRFRFKQGITVTIGRSGKNHIIIENLAVSNHHAQIDSVGDKYLLTDLKSKNGTFVNDKPISLHWLNHGDRITIGKHVLIFAFMEDEEHIHIKDPFLRQTMVMDTDNNQDIMSQTISTGTIARKAQNEAMGVLAYLNGGYGEIELNKKLVRIGTSPVSDIVISGLMIGKTSFIISKRKDGYYLSYVGGFSKPKVNGDVIKETIRLKEFDIIDIGAVKFQFIENA